VRATWAPRGKTPVLAHHFNWKRLSMAGALAYAPDGSGATLIFSMQPGSYNDESLIVFLTDLHDHLDGAKATVIWDGLPSHRSRKMAAFVKSQRHWLVVERLPPYGHELNPVEQVWGNVKGQELANLCPETIREAAETADGGLARIGGDAQLCLAFLRHCGLSL
jgi:transposase